MESDSLRVKRLLHYYNGDLVNDSKRCLVRREHKFFTDPTNASIVEDVQDHYFRDQMYFHPEPYERLCVVELPESSLRHMAQVHERVFNQTSPGGSENYARMVMQKEWAEHELRSNFPAVQAAWEQYSLMLHLASNGKEPI